MTFKRTAAWLSLALATALLPVPALAWEQVGYQQADFNRDRDTIAVSGSERHRAIRLCVEQRPLRMRHLDVRYANGGFDNIPVRSLIGAGSCTRVISLRGNRRNIRQIVMVYDRLTPGAPAIVKVYAR